MNNLETAGRSLDFGSVCQCVCVCVCVSGVCVGVHEVDRLLFGFSR